MLKDIFSKYTNEEIVNAVKKFHNDEDIADWAYHQALTEIRNLDCDIKDNTMTICVHRVIDEFADEDIEDPTYIDVSGREDGVYYAMEFTPWSQWLSMNIEHDEDITELDALGCILWEMTFFGWSQDEVNERCNEIFQSITEAKAEIEAGTAKTIPFDEMISEILKDE